MSVDEEFGARFLAELGRLGVGRGNWKYETVMAIERADRPQFVELFKRASSPPSYELIQLALSNEPEVLARRVVETQQVDDVLPLILFSF